MKQQGNIKSELQLISRFVFSLESELSHIMSSIYATESPIHVKSGRNGSTTG